MGAKSDKPPLPAPTETESTIHTAAPTGTDLGTELGTDVSGPGDERSSYSIPDDGTPVTIKAGHRATKSQTSLLIEYFEGGKGSTASGSTDQRKPSVRVRLTPSSGRRTKSSSSDRDRIKITQSKTRKTSGSSQRSIPAGTGSRADGSEMTSVLGNDYEDASSYASATEESNVSRNPIDIEIERGGSSSRRRRPASPLIPAADSKAGYAPPPSSDISVIPTDSFLDGSGGYTTNSFRMSDLKSSKGSRDRSPPRAADYLAGAAVGAGAATAADKLRNREGRERVVVSRSRDREKDKEKEREREKEKERERRHKSSKSRTSSVSKDDNRRRSTKSHSESLISAADSSVVSSALGPSHRSDVQSVRSAASKASSINNPKLLETVEDAIRRLILPELNALKREQSKRGSRRDSTTSSTTTLSRDDFSSDRRRSGATDKALTPRDSVKISKERRDREARNDFDDSSALSQESVVDSRDLDDTPVRSADHLKTAAAAAALGAAAVAAHEAFISPSEDKHRSRRRRRAEQRSRELGMDGDSDLLAPPGPLMPLMSDVNASDVTRASILSADTDRPRSARSASEEFNGARDFSGSSQLSAASSSAPSGIPPLTLQALGTQHANISHGDLKTLPHQRTGDLDEYVLDDSGKKVPSRHHKARQEEDDYDEDDYPHAPELNQYYSSQDVPPPLKYVPYMPEKRGLSPIPSVSGYTDTGSEHPMPLSRATHRTADSISIKSLRPASRALGEDDDRSVRSSGLTGSVVSPAGSELSQGQPVRAVGFNPDFVHPLGIESNVASLVDGSMLEGSALTVDSEAVGTQRRESMATLEEEHREYGGDRDRTPVSESQRSRGFVEYDVDEYGRKVPQTTTYRESPTASEAAITTAAVGAAADFLRRQNVQGKQVAKEEDEGSFQGAGVQRNRSFKERTKNGHRPGLDSNSTEQLANQHSNPKLGFSGMPDPHDPLPEIGDWHEDDVLTNPSLLGGEGGREDDEHWAEEATPRQHPHHLDDDFHMEPLALSSNSGAAAGAANQNHSRQVSQENGEWYRSPEDKKRDTLVTNPYEGTSPIANLPGLNDSLLGGNNFDYDHDDYDTRSPRVDEGYISQGPNKTPDIQGQGKGINFEIAPLRGPSGALDDPFYTSTRHMSGLSQGMASPLYDAATGTGIERIESKDIIALMQHLMVRDAQRSARDTEILVTLVRSATEMRNNFEDLKKLLADTEDVIITEVKENTEKTVTRAINGPRPYPGSAPRSIHAGSTTNTINEEAKKRSIFRRALKGLGGKSANDLGRIEDMLNQLLTEVDVLKARTAPGPHTGAQGEHLYDNMQQEGQYDQDHGYEPEGLAGTSTASHASQSGYLSIQSRGPSAKPTYDRKVSAHRISTVPEDNEEDHGDEDDNGSINYDQPEVLMTPAHVRADSVPLATPPQPTAQQPQGSLSNENTPRMDEGKKKGRSSWFRNLKVSRWSETTASSAAPESSRLSKQSPRGDEGAFPTGPSRSGSLDHYADNNYELAPPQPIQSDQLHTGFSEQDLPGTLHQDDDSQIMYGQMPQSAPPNWVTMTPEDPKYKAHRDSLNLQHPQPRQGQTERFKAALESQALGFDSPMSPHSADWAGSATSLNRLPGHQHQESYGTPLDPMMYQQHWTSSPAAANITATSGGPPRPPKEPLDHNQQQYPLSGAPSPAPENKRLSKLQKPPLPHQSVESGYGTMTHGASTSSYASHAGTSISPGPQAPQQLENRNLSGALNNGAVNRRPSGPRPMTPTGTGSGRNSGSLAGVGSPLSDDGSVDGGRRKRDTFGSLANAHDMDTF